MSVNLFSYGTLMNKEILFKVMKKDAVVESNIEFIPAKLKKFKRSAVTNVKYPAVYETGDLKDFVDGVLIKNLNAKDLKFLDWFEGDEYTRVVTNVEIEVENETTSNLKAHVYIWTDSMDRLTDESWDASWLNESVKVKHWLNHEINDLENCPTF